MDSAEEETLGKLLALTASWQAVFSQGRIEPYPFLNNRLQDKVIKMIPILFKAFLRVPIPILLQEAFVRKTYRGM